ncbi:MAG: hypothetical protein ACHQUB_02790 [Candidatus Saccharimonadia bacterium]
MSDIQKKWDEQNAAWQKRLITLSEETLIEEQLIKQSRDKLIEYFGEDWLKQQHSKMKVFSPNVPTGVVGIITNPMDNHGVEVVELAKYLEAIEHQNNFEDIIAKLKNASDYEAIRLNLAIGYRLMHSGWTNIFVEPEIGDVSGELFGKKYVVECSVITPPDPTSTYMHEIFRSVYKYLKKNKYAAWIHVQFNKDFKEVPVSNVIDAIKEMNHEFSKDPKTVETLTDDFNMTETYLDERVKKVLSSEREKENGLTEIGYRIAMIQPKLPGDLHSVDPDDPSQVDNGTITFGGMKRFGGDKDTAERIKAKIKNKKNQTANLPKDTRRVFVLMAKGKIDQEDWNELAGTIVNATSPADNLDAVLFMDRRRQEFEGKIRFPSAQVHFFTKPYRMTALEASFKKMKEFENSEWISQ